MEMLLLAALFVTSLAATPHGTPDPLCSVVLTYDEINSATPHWTAGFKIKTTQPMEPGSIVDIQLAGSSNSSQTIPTIVGITVNGHNVCPTEKVLTTIHNFSSKTAEDLSETPGSTTAATATTAASSTDSAMVTTDANDTDTDATTIESSTPPSPINS